MLLDVPSGRVDPILEEMIDLKPNVPSNVQISSKLLEKPGDSFLPNI